MNIENFFDEIYCINLKTRKDRWEECENEFSEHHIKMVKRYNAVEGIPPSVKTYGLMNVAPDDPLRAKKIANRVGCLMSHLSIIKQAREKKLKSILILEDDVQFVKNVSARFSEFVGQVPDDWSLLYFGGNERKGLKKVSSNICRTTEMLMTHAVGVHQNAYDELIQMISQCEAPVDFYYATIQKKFPAYTFYPFLAWQRAGWSDLEQRFRIYDLECLSPALENILKCNMIE